MAVVPVPLHDTRSLLAALEVRGYPALMVSTPTDLDFVRPGGPERLALLDANAMDLRDLKLCVSICSRLDLPAIALVPPARLPSFDTQLDVADFVLFPPRVDELVVRVRRALGTRSATADPDTIRAGDLGINTATFEVSVDGRRVGLRFKEYELLLLMAANPGRVYSREVLLNRIWGYEYLGGTRTVDVHIRRLRSKIEDAGHRFIETVWQVGYRFRDVDQKEGMSFLESTDQ